MNQNDNDSFLEHLKRASQEVSTWPKWKQELLGGEAVPNPKQEKMMHDFDEAVTTMLRVIPDSLQSFYKALQDKGFTDIQAFELTRDYMRIILTPRT